MAYILNDAKRVVGRIGNTGANNYVIHATLEERSTDIGSNTSSLYYKVWLTAENDAYVTDIDGNRKYMSGWAFDDGNITAYININGSTFASAQNSRFSMGYPGYGYSYPSSVTILEGTKSITHNSDGSLSVSVTAGITNNNNYSATPASGSMSKSASLTTIPRASTLSVTSSQTMGTSYRFTISRASSSFRHKITYAFGNTSGTVLDTTTSDVTTKDWTPPTSLASQSVVTGGNKSATITYYLYTYSGGSQIGSVSATATLSIPSADSLSSVTASQTMGTAYTFTCTRNAENYTHKLNWSFGSASGTDNTAFATSKSFTPATSLGSQIPSSNSGTIYYSITTYNGSTVVGTSSTKSATLSIPSGAEPTFSFSASVTNGNSLGVAIVGYSTVAWSTTGVSTKYGATVASYSFSFAGVSSTDGTKSGVKLISGSAGGTSYTPTMVVTDSRGKKTTHTASAVTVYTYSAPVIVSSYAYRSDDSGTRKDDSEKCAIFINAKTDYSCSGKNTISTRLRARVSNGSWGSWYTMTNNQRMIAEGYALTLSYQIELQVVDSLGGTKSATYTIPTASVAFNIKEGGKGAAFFGYAQQDGALTINGLLDVFGTQIIGGQASQMLVRSSNRNSPQAGIAVQLTDTENLFLLYGSSRNRGLYDGTNSKWMAYTDGYHTFIPGKLIEVSKFVEATTSFAYHGTSITIPANHGALIVGGRNWNSNMPVEVGLSSSSTSFSGYGGAYASGTPTARPNHVLWCIALLGVSPSARTVYLWGSASHTGNSTEYLHAYLME